MATLLVGLSGNPITNAHLILARFAIEEGGFHEAIFIPCGDAPHKSNLISFEHRLEMVKLAIKGEAGFDFTSIEGEWAKNGKKSFTIDTYRYLRDNIAGKNVSWMIGGDNVSQIMHWHDFPAIRKEVQFAVIPREISDHGNLTLGESIVHLDHFGIKYKALNIPLLPISSTMVRDRVQKCRSIRGLVPDAVDDYIKKNGLYKGV